MAPRAGDLDCGMVTTQPVAVAHEEIINLGALTVDPAGRRATVKGSEVNLARKEFALLILAAQPDRVFSKEELLATVWGHTGPEQNQDSRQPREQAAGGRLARARRQHARGRLPAQGPTGPRCPSGPRPREQSRIGTWLAAGSRRSLAAAGGTSRPASRASLARPAGDVPPHPLPGGSRPPSTSQGGAR